MKDLNKDESGHLSKLALINGMAVLFIGLLAGVMLVFSMLGGVGLWPLPIMEIELPGTTRGWSAAHVGGILNGLMIAVMAVLMRYLEITGKSAFWVGWGLIITGWGNTLFYWAGNVSANRGLSVSMTPYGPGDVAGALAFLGGGFAMIFTFILVIIVALAAWRTS